MTTINVQFSDDAKSAIIGYAASPQDVSVWPYQGTVDTSDPMWSKYYSVQDANLIQPYLPTPSTD